MDEQAQPQAASLNARAGALALVVGAGLNLVVRLEAPLLQPLSYLAWLTVSFGAWAFCDEMGAGRPLNRAGLVLFAAAFCADTAALLASDAAMVVRADRLYAFTTLGALLLWSVAMAHRRSAARATGMLGASVGAGAIGLLVGAHVLVGSVTLFGFGQLFADGTSGPPRSALSAIDGLLFAWSLAAAALMWTGRLGTASPAAARPQPA